MDHRRVPCSATIAFILHRKTKAMVLSGTHPWSCNYYNMRGIAEAAGTWSDLIDIFSLMKCVDHGARAMCKAG